MVQFDLPLEELEVYAPALPEPSDLDAFWTDTLDETRSYELGVRLDRVDTHLACLQTWDVTFNGFGGHPVRAWLHLPVARERAGNDGLPMVVQYHGYGGGRGLPHETMLWAVAGYAHLVMDTRGQGSLWSQGETPDPVGAGPSVPGFMTRGVLDPRQYYYRRVFADAVRAVEAARSHPDIDPARVAVAGGSQGGGIALAVSALVPDVAAMLSDVPFLCNFRRAIEITDREPYAELTRYLSIHRGKADQVLRTLSYFDGALLARRAHAPALFSVGLMDQTCPPSTVYAAFNAYAGPKRIVPYPYNDHEAGQSVHAVEQLHWLQDVLG